MPKYKLHFRLHGNTTHTLCGIKISVGAPYTDDREATTCKRCQGMFKKLGQEPPEVSAAEPIQIELISTATFDPTDIILKLVSYDQAWMLLEALESIKHHDAHNPGHKIDLSTQQIRVIDNLHNAVRSTISNNQRREDD